MRSYAQVLTTPTVDTPGTTILIHCDQKRYLFGNVSEGTQRAVSERGAKLAKVWDIFLTGQVRWSTTGGLIGLILTLADVTKTSELALRENEARAAKKPVKKEIINDLKQATDSTLTVHGARNLTHLLATCRKYILRKGMPVNVDEIDEDDMHGSGSAAPTTVNGVSMLEVPDEKINEALSKSRDVSIPTWSDENIKVWAMVIGPQDSQRHSSPRRARKRSYEEIEGEEQVLSDTVVETAKERKEKGDQIRKAVVSKMFDSDWHLDRLVETPLSEVALPATLFVRDSDTGEIKRYTGPLPQNGDDSVSTTALADIRVLVRKPWPAALIGSLPPTSPSHQSISYIVKNHERRGKFLPEKARELNVEMGYKWAQLTKGFSVEAADGKTVTPEMVLAESKPGGGIAIVELPSTDHVESLINREEWRTKEVMEGVGAIIWILGPQVSQDEKLLEFVKKMAHLRHFFSSSDYCPNYVAFDSAAAQTRRLNQIDPIRFPVPTYNDQPNMEPRRRSFDTSQENETAFEPAHRGMIIDLVPTFGVKENSVVPFLDMTAAKEQALKDAVQLGVEAREVLERSETIQELDRSQRDLPGKDAEVITLGTGSMVPSKYRSVSATLLRVPGYGSYLFDCGEGTLGQLCRVFSEKELKEVLQDLKVIWISHMHADHHLGTVSVIKAWYEEVWGGCPNKGRSFLERQSTEELTKKLREGKRLFVISDHAMIEWLKEYSEVENFGYHELVPLSIAPVNPSKPQTSSRMTWEKTLVGFDTEDQALNEVMTSSTGLSSIQAARVSHCQGSYAVSFTFSDGFKFSYSGDCRPSKTFAEIGKGTTVLVHEATFDDALRREARAKKHCTTSEALAVGMAMGARRVILTHFSQRYQKIPMMDKMEGREIRLNEAQEAKEGEDMAEDEGLEDVSAAPTTPTTTSNQSTTATEKDGEPAVIKIRGDGSQDMKVGVAFDYMRVKVGEISHLEYFTPALVKLFAEEE